jgi:periplasmic protein TonB
LGQSWLSGPDLDDGPTVTVVKVPKPEIIIPPPLPIKPPEAVKPRPLEQVQTPLITTPAVATRQSKSPTANPLTSELPAGPVADEPVIFAPIEPMSGVREWVEPDVMAPIVTLPKVEDPPPPVARLVINPVRMAGANPIFPNRPLERGISGEVTLSFTVSTSGKVENINVTGENPSGYGFARAAREAIQGWTFQPQTIDGIPVAYPARYTISFKLED